MTDDFDHQAIATPAQVRLLGSPVRQELVDTLAVLRDGADVATLAEQLGRPADGLYYHLRALAAGGLVEETPVADGGERRYRLTRKDGTPLRLAYDLGPGGNSAELRVFVRGLLHIAGRDFDDALAAKDLVVAGARRELWASRNKGWLSGDDLAEANALLERLSELTSQPKADGRDHLASLAFVLAPIDPKPRRRVSRKAE